MLLSNSTPQNPFSPTVYMFLRKCLEIKMGPESFSGIWCLSAVSLTHFTQQQLLFHDKLLPSRLCGSANSAQAWCPENIPHFPWDVLDWWVFYCPARQLLSSPPFLFLRSVVVKWGWLGIKLMTFLKVFVHHDRPVHWLYYYKCCTDPPIKLTLQLPLTNEQDPKVGTPPS